jgi:hypothetical protein
MKSRKTLGVTILIAFGGLIIAGCGTQKPVAPVASEDATGEEAHHQHGDADHDHANTTHDNAEINPAMTKLSPADRKLAEEQKICPVSGEPLGSMGVPVKVTLEGRDVFVCCEGCVDELKQNFQTYAAKLDKTP